MLFPPLAEFDPWKTSFKLGVDLTERPSLLCFFLILEKDKREDGMGGLEFEFWESLSFFCMFLLKDGELAVFLIGEIVMIGGEK